MKGGPVTTDMFRDPLTLTPLTSLGLANLWRQGQPNPNATTMFYTNILRPSNASTLPFLGNGGLDNPASLMCVSNPPPGGSSISIQQMTGFASIVC
ncbi:MAG: hypothetical protein MUF77_12660 [Leptospira sp.]|nr:hypothetical protein [Leptospira sp.]